MISQASGLAGAPPQPTRNHKVTPTPAGLQGTTSRSWTPHAVITILEDTPPFETDENQQPTLTPKGDIMPGNSRKRMFPRGLRRLRDRLQTLEDRLKLDVNALRQQIADLHLQCSLVETRTQLQLTARLKGAVGTVVEYFGAFHHGWLEETTEYTVGFSDIGKLAIRFLCSGERAVVVGSSAPLHGDKTRS